MPLGKMDTRQAGLLWIVQSAAQTQASCPYEHQHHSALQPQPVPLLEVGWAREWGHINPNCPTVERDPKKTPWVYGSSVCWALVASQKRSSVGRMLRMLSAA